ncbi:serine/arginine-rich splicing factor SR45a-like [Melia azedarach]|uniref:Serine/arginine-rich splicing factor SR45a-like n=1 Tax=Melia azedarach TaxID=155640 RepID=A0ACC1XLE0_MELAZ|nr:serine/arginine-rich splicing factor SR45a-like [Melia azedarach]
MNQGSNLFIFLLCKRFQITLFSKHCSSAHWIAKRSRGRTPTPGRYQGLRDRRGNGRRHSRSYSPRRYDRDPYSRDRRGRSRSPYGRGRSRSPYDRRRDYYSDSHRRHRERSLSAGGSGYPR